MMALHMLGATELLFAQYQQDDREHSNPAGVLGLASAMHCEFESTAIYSNVLTVRRIHDRYEVAIPDLTGFRDTFCEGRVSGFTEEKRARARILAQPGFLSAGYNTITHCTTGIWGGRLTRHRHAGSAHR